jgi:hypothetical protein
LILSNEAEKKEVIRSLKEVRECSRKIGQHHLLPRYLELASDNAQIRNALESSQVNPRRIRRILELQKCSSDSQPVRREGGYLLFGVLVKVDDSSTDDVLVGPFRSSKMHWMIHAFTFRKLK